MKLTVKTLTGGNFPLEIDASATVLECKNLISTTQPFEADRQKLIYAGKVLKDDETLAASGVKENDFLVCMVSKPKAAPAPAPAAAPAPAPAPAAAAPAAPAPAPAAAAPAPAAPAAAAPAPAAAGPALDPSAVSNLVDMGFPEDQVRAALSAAFGNSERAVEYLMTGIPESARAPPPPPAAAPATGGAAPATGGDPLAMLRSHPQINQLKRLVQSNPSALPMVLQQIGQASPQLLELITANREAFIALMNEPVTEDAPAAAAASGGMPGGMPGMPGGMDPRMMAAAIQAMTPEQRDQMATAFGISPDQLGAVAEMLAARAGGEGAVPPGATVIRLTEAENAAVERLMAMGFERNQVIEAFLACDKNEELAANFLLESMNDG